MKLEVGMYVRLQNDAENIVIINRIANVFETTILTENDGSIYQGEYTKENVIKASYNIIDILGENDYVNGLRVEKNKYGELYTSYVYYGGDIGKQCEVYTTWLKELKEDMIYNVATHEQMEQMAYKVG